MGFITNVLEYGWNAGCIITEAEREADRICKGIKTTIIEDVEDENESEEGDDGEVDMTGFKIIFHPEWLPEKEQERWERMQQKEHYEPEVIDSIMDAHKDIINYLDEQSKGNGRQDN